MALKNPIDCGTRRQFKWNSVANKSEVAIPTKCQDCDDEQVNYCIEKSFVAEGKNAKGLKLIKVTFGESQTADNKIINQAKYEDTDA